MITEERIHELREAYKRRGANTDVALDHLIRTAAKESAEQQVRKDAHKCHDLAEGFHSLKMIAKRDAAYLCETLITTDAEVATPPEPTQLKG